MDNQDLKNCSLRKTGDVGGQPTSTGSIPELLHGEWYLGYWAGDSMLAVMCYDQKDRCFSEHAFSAGRPMSATDYAFTPIAHMIK